MEKKLTTKRCRLLNKQKTLILQIMKRSLILSILFFSITVFSFSQKISIKMGKVSLYEALKEIKKETNVDFFYSDKDLNVDRVVLADFTDTDIVEIVSKLVGKMYTIQKTEDGILLITPLYTTNFQNEITVQGVITDNFNNPLPGVTVIVKGTKQGATSDIDGNYTINADEESTLVFSYIGYKTKEIAVNGNTVINVTLQPDLKELEEVVITGIVQRKKESYTGAVNTITGAELKAIGNQNIIQSIKTLDPSFVVLENTQLGSNPNVLPNIEVRGKSSISNNSLQDEFGADPNQPLFVLDGFETNLRTIVDLDMNRIKSITILKDAASTALYGAKAANGVVVVETLRPTSGELRLSYSGDFSVEIPDLTDYNLMNAEEKLEFERLSGRWTSFYVYPANQLPLDSIYNAKLADVRRGVDTYWLDKPLQTGFSQRHSVNVDGGTEDISMRAGINFKNQDGVMKGSGRQTWGGNLDLTYRKNKFNISNRLYVSGFNADESPYGSFTKFARANPYYKPETEEGIIEKYLDQVSISSIANYNLVNPLYSQFLGNFDTTNGLNIQNSLEAIYTLNPNLRLSGGLQIKKGNSTQEAYTSPNDPLFDGAGTFEKGRFIKTEQKNFSYLGNVMLTYSKVINEIHSINANLRADVEETRNELYRTTAIGFPAGTNGNPSFAFSYEPDASPYFRSTLYRRNNVLASVNYSYKNTYLIDGTFRMDGSTAFGSNKQYSPFWAIGAGWNLHNEFDFNKEVIDLLKVRANIGSTGNQNFGSVATTSVYGFVPELNSFGQGTELLQLANENLEWQNTLQTNIGLDVQLFKRRFSGSFEYFNKKTNPLVVLIDLPSSTGVQGYPYNVGELNVEGFESVLKYSPIYQVENQIVWTLGATVSTYKSEYSGLNNALESLDDAELASQSVIRYRDGYSPDDIWAVPSLGIDPATGREVFMQANGEPTFVHNYDDVAVVGNSRPTMEGVLSSNLNYKGFLLGVNVRYRFGGELFNRALYNKVEDISLGEIAYNQDRRALFDRWQQPGDNARFKAIGDTGSTPISSRFVQKEDVLIGESINVGYRTENKAWLTKFGLSSLRINAYMNDIFRASTVRAERGIEYPFSRSVSLSINATF